MIAGHAMENVLFATALSGFTLLLLLEKKRPYRKLATSSLQQSFSTNTYAFLFNTMTMNILSVTSLLVITANYSHYGFLSEAYPLTRFR